VTAVLSGLETHGDAAALLIVALLALGMALAFVAADRAFSPARRFSRWACFCRCTPHRSLPRTGLLIFLAGAVQFHVTQGKRAAFMARFLAPQMAQLVARRGLRHVDALPVRNRPKVTASLSRTYLSGSPHF